MKLSSIKQDLSQLKQSVRKITGIVDTPVNIQVSGGQEFQSEDAVFELRKLTYLVTLNKLP